MRITWKDGITTLATAGAIVLERAYFHEWSWPLISSMRWTIAGLAILMAISLFFSYVRDEFRSFAWSMIAKVLGLCAAALTGLGMFFVISDYVVLLMLNIIVFWIASLARHITMHVPMHHHPA